MAEKLTITKWKELIEQVNELASECNLPPLEEVETPHRWSKTDIEKMQNTLKEICDQNEFDDPPEKWLQDTIDKIEEAIASGACCCEDEIIPVPLNEVAQFRVSPLAEPPSPLPGEPLIRLYDWITATRFVQPNQNHVSFEMLASIGTFVLIQSGTVDEGELILTPDQAPFSFEFDEDDDGLAINVIIRNNVTDIVFNGSASLLVPPTGIGAVGPYGIFATVDANAVGRLDLTCGDPPEEES